MAKNIKKRSDDYAQWYLDVIKAAQLADYSPVRGCMVIRPEGYAIWEAIQSDLDRRLKSLDVSIEASTQIHAQRAKLAAAETGDRAGRQAIEEAFITGYRSVLCVAVGLALASACTAAAMVTTKRDAR